MEGRLARQDGTPREAWERLAYRVDRDAPDDPASMHTPAWWLAHWFDGPLIRAWLDGWDDEDRRVAAGGPPMDEDERREASDDLDRLGSRLHDLGLEGRHCRMDGRDLSFVQRLMGDEEFGRFAPGPWDVETKAAIAWVEAAIARVRYRLEPHRV